jgi:hypothetical protein
MMRPIDNNEYLDVLIEKGVKIVETSGHSAPEDLCRRFKEAGVHPDDIRHLEDLQRFPFTVKITSPF